jgi:hypothetical protein
MLRYLLLSLALLLAGGARAAEPAAGSVNAGKEQKSARPPAAVKPGTASTRTAAPKPAAARRGVHRNKGLQARGTPPGEQAASPGTRMNFLQQFAAADQDGDGLLSRDEAERNDLASGEAFDNADASHDGWLTPEEWRSYLQASHDAAPHS